MKIILFLITIFISVINFASAEVNNRDTINCCEKTKDIIFVQSLKLTEINKTLERINILLSNKTSEQNNITVNCCKEIKRDNEPYSIWPFIIAIVPGGFALIQLRLNHIKNYRIEWIKELKTNVSDFITLLNLLNSKVANMTLALSKLDRQDSDYESKKKATYTEHYLKIQQINYKVDKANSLIRLNISVKDNQNLINDLDEFATKTMVAYRDRKLDEEGTMNTLAELEEKILKQTNELINSEWKKIKSFWKA